MARPTPPRLHQARQGSGWEEHALRLQGLVGEPSRCSVSSLAHCSPWENRGHLEQAQLGEANGVSRVRASSSTFPSQVREPASCGCPRLLHCPPSLGPPSMVPSTGLKPALTCVLPMICTPRMSASQPGVIPSQPPSPASLQASAAPCARRHCPRPGPPTCSLSRTDPRSWHLPFPHSRAPQKAEGGGPVEKGQLSGQLSPHFREHPSTKRRG